MAILKTVELDNGMTGNYWKITGLDIDFSHESASILISLFKDEPARRANKEHIIYMRAILPPDSYSDFISGKYNPLQLAYEQLKTMKLNNFDFTEDSSDV